MRGVLLGLTLFSAALAPAAQAAGRTLRPPVIVELYTAQGCDACAQANQLVGALAERSGVLPLTFSVDYWDYLGWKDTFAAPEFAERQKAYVERLKVRDIYTPEVVVNGRAEAPGVDAARIEALLRKARVGSRAGLRLSLGRRAVRVGSGEGAGDVWLVRYDPKPRVVRVRGDDRKTRNVTAVNVVRQLVRLGSWRGRARSFVLTASPPGEGLSTLVLLQGKDGGPILGAATG